MHTSSLKYSLKDILLSPRIEFLMEAHNGISAKIVEEAGFKGIWASGLAISASYGVRDCNEASWTQILETVGFMRDCTSIPILVDGDTGFGNYNNVRRLVKHLEKIQVDGVCIEDKLFPKMNSFMEGVYQELSSIKEFCGKIKAAKDTQLDPSFCVVARTEAFVLGSDLGEVLARASAYAEAGADAVLIHSKLQDASHIIAFMREWNKQECKVPIVIIPTTYDKTPTTLFQELGISLVIWANHNLRASIAAMQAVSRKVYENSCLTAIQTEIASIDEIFRLTNMAELEESEKRYLSP